ncbi:hypothetical protein SLEP1_g7675 [Rubroshorea leprosula]|uniref:Bulb-type lectin domain-containing protein n=1 Tax=Rubroshorea leprosula TaxID=152421 RepID=A0AAV5I949_9ROSI|nr:hypothetical protein SLEP1_g7675 [Rubroshorea leprosula]
MSLHLASNRLKLECFLLATWFDKVPEKNIVWSANCGNLVLEESKIQLTTDSQFVLNDPKGQEVWMVNLYGTGNISYAAMLDTGNFVLPRQDSTNLWESFDHPTDTILPTQTLNVGSSLFACYSEMNYSGGRFMMQLLSNGNLAIFNQSGYIYLEAKNGSIISFIAVTGASTGNFYQRAILEYDGVFRQYVYPKNYSVSARRPMAWSLIYCIPQDICTSIRQATGGGACGFNSYNILANDQRPKCMCPPGYSFLDPDDDMNGCKQDFISQECDGGQDADLFYFKDMPNTAWPDSDYECFQSVTEDWCRQEKKDASALYNTRPEFTKLHLQGALRKLQITSKKNWEKMVTEGEKEFQAEMSAIEHICHRKNFEQDADNENQMILADWAYDCHEERTLHLLVQEDEEAIQDIKMVEKFVMIAIWCIQDDLSLRPTMKRASQMLEGAIERTYLPVTLIPELKDGIILGYDQPRLKSVNFSKESKTHIVWNCRFHPDTNCLGSNVCQGFFFKERIEKRKDLSFRCVITLAIHRTSSLIMKLPALPSQSFSLDHIALLLQKCLKAKALKPGKQVHAWSLATGADMKLLSLNAKLVGMYASCGDLGSARLSSKGFKSRMLLL